MDLIHQKLVSKPIFTTADALDKLAFADYCLTEEPDIKEASNLLRQVFAALLISMRNSRAIDELRDLPDGARRSALAE